MLVQNRLAIAERPGKIYTFENNGATKDRQLLVDTKKTTAAEGLKRLGGADLVLVVGSTNSSNSQRLVEVARSRGSQAYLIDDVTEIDDSWLDARTQSIALTAGASAPEALVDDVARYLAAAGWRRGGSETPSEEGITFTLPADLRRIASKSP